MALQLKSLLASQVLINIAVDEDVNRLRTFFSDLLLDHALPDAAIQLGACCENLSTAFFCGYQVAMRCLDPRLGCHEFAALCASETGVQSSRDFTSQVVEPAPCQYLLSGEKSHVMLMARGILDQLYVLANTAQHKLLALKLDAKHPNIQVLEARKPQPFVPEVPHTPVRFLQVPCHPDFVITDAHRRCFKPFRYWEDVMVSLSFAGWMMARLSEEEIQQEIWRLSRQLSDEYHGSPEYYSASAIHCIDQLIQTLQNVAGQLPQAEAQQWQQDSLLLLLGKTARDKAAATLMQR